MDKRKNEQILEIASKIEHMKQKDSDMEILMIGTTHMTGDEFEIVLTMKS